MLTIRHILGMFGFLMINVALNESNILAPFRCFWPHLIRNVVCIKCNHNLDIRLKSCKGVLVFQIFLFLSTFLWWSLSHEQAISSFFCYQSLRSPSHLLFLAFYLIAEMEGTLVREEALLHNLHFLSEWHWMEFGLIASGNAGCYAKHGNTYQVIRKY